ncbi:hypothetical protein [Shewanella surugensis]|uniref:Polymer-forming cytoskeletal protein n=1 Tax=Shewanella surugensis TaxID=212020 RepID=A0ABT0L774_9GAMM|nr:hypothetical protein [Shewanella surugensis]MCL1123207.1 hypothetical protein [Shewanella surugensis]
MSEEESCIEDNGSDLSTEKTTRSQLAEKFADNQVPTGSDFSQLIHSGINQLDDGICVEAGTININKPVILTGEINTLKVTGNAIVTSELNVYDDVSFSGELDVIGDTNLSGELDVTGDANLSGELDVIGDTHLSGRLTAGGHTQLNDALDVTGNVCTEQALTVQGRAEFQQTVNIGGVASTTADALLNIKNKVNGAQDLLRLEDITADPSPMVVKSNGLVGIGTACPEAMLEINSTYQPELLSIRKGDKTYVRVNTSDNADVANIQLNSRTQVDDALTVTGTLTAGSTEITGSLTVSEALTAGPTVVNGALSASTSTISGQSQTDTLVVGDEGEDDGTTVEGRPSSASVIFNKNVHAKKLTSLNNANIYGKLDAQSQLSANYANVRNTLLVGLPDSVVAEAALQVNGLLEGSSALLVKDYEHHELIRARKGEVILGDGSHSVNLQVKGHTEANSLTVNGLSNLTDTSISKHLSVGEPDHDISSDSSEHARFCLTSDPSIPKALHVKHQDGTTVTHLMASKADKLGVHVSEPQVAFHVGAVSLFDESVNFATGFEVKAAGGVAPSLSVSSAQITFGLKAQPVPFDVYGRTCIMGDLAVHNLLNVDTDSFTLTQQVDAIPFKIETENVDEYIHASAGQLAINTRLSTYQFDLKGSTRLAGQLIVGSQDLDVNMNALDVTGGGHISDTFTVDGQTFLNDAVTVIGPLNVSYSTLAGDDINALNVTGHGLISQSLTVSDMLTVGNGLSVTGSGTFNHSLSVSGAADFSQTLDVIGKVTAEDELHIQGNDSTGLSMTVDKRADFNENLSIVGDIGFSTLTPDARLHIHQTDASKTAFKIDGLGEDDAGFIFKQGKLGIGIDEPSDMLEVAGSVKIHQDLHVKRQAYLDNCLYVDQLATFSSNIKVHGLSEFNGQTVIGDLHCPDNDAARTAQLCLFQNNYASAFKIMFENDSPVVFSDGKLGVGTDSPEAALDVRGEVEVQGGLFVKQAVEIRGPVTQYQGADVWGDVVLHSDLTVNDNTVLEDTLDVMGKTRLNNTLDVSRAGNFTSTLDVTDNVTFNANLEVNTHTHLRGNLTVSNVDADVILCPATLLENTLTVNKASQLKGKVQLDDTLAIGLDKQQAQAHVHLMAAPDQAALIVDVPSQISAVNQDEAVSNTIRALILDASGRLGLNCSAPTATLDVKGNAKIAAELTAEHVIVSQSIGFEDATAISGFSNDVTLGGEGSSDCLLPTQAAVKAYVDESTWGFGDDSQTLIINNQTEFDAIFNCGEQTVIADNTTILLFPLMNSSGSRSEYLLKNPVRLGAGVSINGFNEKATCIMKAHANCRFMIYGESLASLVEGIKLTGFTFNGDHHVYSGPGGAFELRYAQHCQLNCRVINHQSATDGGAIYAYMEGTNHTVSHIEAMNIIHCKAEMGFGGAAYGLAFSRIRAESCRAKSGGAVAYCDDSQVEALNNTALVRGGGAYLCKNLLCHGFWKGNRGGEGKHIYANHCQSDTQDHLDDKYYWHGVYLDGPLLCQTDYWSTENI